MEIKKMVEEWKIWNKEEEVAKSEEKAKKFVPQRFHEWIYIFRKKASKRMLMKKVWNHAIEIKKGFIPRKGKVYLLSREERRKMCEFIEKQLRKEYIRLLKLPQTASVFFIGKKNDKKRMVQNYRYLNEWAIKDLRWGYTNMWIKKRDK